MGVVADPYTVRHHVSSLTLSIKLTYLPSLRKLAPQIYPSAQELLQHNPYTPTSELANAIMSSSSRLTELVAVREWLHETAPYPTIDPGPVTGYWTFTKYELLQNKRLGKGKERETAGGLVLQLDPDSPNRGEGRALAADDAVRIIGYYYLYSVSPACL